MFALTQHFQHTSCQAQVALARLIRVCIDAKRDWFWHIRLFCQLPSQKLRRIDLDEYFAFEIQSRRQAQVTVGGTREAIDAAMLASAIRIERNAERHIRRLITAEYGFGMFFDDLGLPCQSCIRLVIFCPVSAGSFDDT